MRLVRFPPMTERFFLMNPIYEFRDGRVTNLLTSWAAFPARVAKRLSEVRAFCVKDTEVSRCAVPHCSITWKRMGEGKLFMFHVRTPAFDGTSTKKVWLCENCFESWDVTLNQECQPVLAPRQRMAH